MKIALITGITGQDGSYLAELLLGLNYQVHGIVRRSSYTTMQRIDHLSVDKSIHKKQLFLHYADLDDTTTIRRLIAKTQPTEIYHLAGQSHVGASFEIPESTCEFTAMGTLRLLEIIRDCNPAPKFLHISSSEIFGEVSSQPQNELTAMRPMTPYGVAKAFATQMVRVYRESFGMFACNAICYNHESPRRGESFVTRKITRAAARIKNGLQSELLLGNIDGQRDWGFAPDYMRGLHAVLQLHQPKDFLFATGKLHRVSDWLEIAFGALGLDWRAYVKYDPQLKRSADPISLVGDASSAHRELNWSPSIEFEDMVRMMTEADLQIQAS